MEGGAERRVLAGRAEGELVQIAGPQHHRPGGDAPLSMQQSAPSPQAGLQPVDGTMPPLPPPEVHLMPAGGSNVPAGGGDARTPDPTTLPVPSCSRPPGPWALP